MQALKHLPNLLTATRIALSLPVALCILRQDYAWALAFGLIAGLTDALDGLAARALNAHSRLGAGLDAAADKLLMFCVFLSLAQVGLLPWWLAGLVVGRDVVIVTGATAYRFLVGPFDFAPTGLSKLNMAVQVLFLVCILVDAMTPFLTTATRFALVAAVAITAVVSGVHYVLAWSRRARVSLREPGSS
jgi:cardiolipin synthase